MVENNEKLANEDFEERLLKHRKKVRLMMLIGVSAVLVLILVFVLVNNKSTFSEYTELVKIRKTDSKSCDYIPYGDGFLRVSKDGVSFFNYRGEQYWNKSYEMKNNRVDVDGDYFSIADIGANTVYFFNSEGYKCTVTTSVPIVDAVTTRSGYVVVAMHDGKTGYINMYDTSGNKVYTIKATLTDTGLPLTMDVSQDGEKLAVAYTAVSESKLKTNIVFYNFGTVGQNMAERIVGGYESDGLIGRIVFTGNTNVIAYAENGFSIYKIKEYPSLVQKVDIATPIKSVFENGEYEGLIVSDENDASLQKMLIYDNSGDALLEMSFSKTANYDKFAFAEDLVLMYGKENMMLIKASSGKTIYSGAFQDSISSIGMVDGKDTYLCISSEFIEKIKLK